MNRSKLIQLFVILILVLSFTVTPTQALFEPQAGTVDEDGDLVVEVLPPLEGTGADPVKIPAGQETLPDDGLSGDLISVDSVPLDPIGYVDLFDKTPTFWFARDYGAVKYKIEVWNVFKNTLVYSVKTSGNCSGSECSVTPLTALKNYVYTSGQGYYRWRVYSKDPLFGWGGPSDFEYFYVNSTGFNSNFDIDANKWLSVYGDWFRVDPGYLKTKGVTYEYASAIQKEWFANDYVYEVVMKRKVSVYGDSPSNRMYFMGYPGSNPYDGWDAGYEFIYFDEGDYYLQVIENGSATYLLSGITNAINPYGWNKLTVWTDYPYIDIWINGTYLGWTQINDDPAYYTGGYVGLTGYKNSTKSALLVDSAKLKYTLKQPYSISLNPDGTRDPAYELTVDPTLVEPEG